ncbi:hypothetical protein OHA72_43405 [Dactylosporangium sp. NBC_01737]|nr:hypothetical protein OHA72_43405 [Dactylosporangium sp. NBC_01737]
MVSTILWIGAIGVALWIGGGLMNGRKVMYLGIAMVVLAIALIISDSN